MLGGSVAIPGDAILPACREKASSQTTQRGGWLYDLQPRVLAEKETFYVMRKLCRRIEIVEKSTMSIRRTHQAIGHRALEQMSSENLDLLISAFGADREERPLTERE